MAFPAWAQQWDNMAVISGTLGNTAGRVCVGAGVGDIGCPTYAPSVNSAGLLTVTNISTTNVSATGNISANAFVGDGSQLTGVVAAATDRITSGTTSFIVISNTGYISLTQAGANTGWFDPTRGLVTLGVSSTGPISGTRLYSSGPLTVAGNSILAAISATNISASGNISANRFIGDGSGLTGVTASSADWYSLTNIPAQVAAVSASGGISLTNISITTNATVTGALTAGSAGFGPVAMTTLNATGNSTLAAVSATNISASANVSAQNFIGTFVGDGSQLTGVTAASADRITSGTTSFIVISNTGFISLTQASTNTGWFDPTRGLVTLGVSSTGPISGTRLFSSGPLTVAGNSILASISATNISASGNISAVRFIGDGSGLTGVTASSADWYSLTNIPAQVAAVSASGGISLTNISITTNATVTGVLTAGSAGFGPVAMTTLNATGNSTLAAVSATNISASANVSAQNFIGTFVGDGSQLTGVVASSADRITSGTTSFIVISNTGFISLTQASTNTGWFDPTRGLVTLGVSSTGAISGTNLYASGRVGVGGVPVTNTLEVYGYIAANGTNTITSPPPAVNASLGWKIGFYDQGYAMGVAGFTLAQRAAGWASTFRSANPANNATASTPDSNAIFSVGGTSNTVIVSQTLGVGTSFPSATLHVSGTVALGGAGASCGGNTHNSLKVENGKLYLCRQ